MNFPLSFYYLKIKKYASVILHDRDAWIAWFHSVWENKTPHSTSLTQTYVWPTQISAHRSKVHSHFELPGPLPASAVLSVELSKCTFLINAFCISFILHKINKLSILIILQIFRHAAEFFPCQSMRWRQAAPVLMSVLSSLRAQA